MMAGVRDTWDARIRRAEALAADDRAASAMLAFYAIALRSQQRIFDALSLRTPSSMLARDVALVREAARPLLEAVALHGPEALAREAQALCETANAVVDEALVSYWRAPSAPSFFPKAILQPYGEWLARAGVAPGDREAPGAANCCPRCGGLPQLSILTEGASAPDAIADSGGRSLQCANCLHCWPFRRVRCASCGEEDEAKLGYFRSEEFAHLRIDSCDT